MGSSSTDLPDAYPAGARSAGTAKEAATSTRTLLATAIAGRGSSATGLRAASGEAEGCRVRPLGSSCHACRACSGSAMVPGGEAAPTRVAAATGNRSTVSGG